MLYLLILLTAFHGFVDSGLGFLLQIIKNGKELYILAHPLEHVNEHGLVEGSFEVKLPTICRDGKAEVGRVREETSRSETIRDRESQKREDAGARKGRKVAIHCVFPMICGSGGRKVTSLKRRVRSQLAS